MFAARLSGGPHHAKKVRLNQLVDPLQLIDPARVTIDTFWPCEAIVEYRLTEVFGKVAFYDFVE